MKLRKRQIFRWLVNTFDNINIWFEDKFNLNPKKQILEAKQDLVTLEELDNTIGKSLGL